jgi:hypothetical protein
MQSTCNNHTLRHGHASFILPQLATTVLELMCCLAACFKRCSQHIFCTRKIDAARGRRTRRMFCCECTCGVSAYVCVYKHLYVYVLYTNIHGRMQTLVYKNDEEDDVCGTSAVCAHSTTGPCQQIPHSWPIKGGA